ncbi:MAG: ABC transporter substrate-binding protein [Pseudomonadota bacterium]|nr:ABC transporter substrate-binding protein [Pseudomonadota bacterium]
MVQPLHRRQFLAVAGSSLAAAFLGGCPRPADPLRLGLPPWPANDLYVLAEQLGYYRDTPVRIIDYASASQELRAFRNAVLDVSSCTLDEALLLALDVPDLRVIQVLDLSFGADVILVHPEIPSLEALRGLRVGYEATALGAYVLGRGLELAGLTPKDVTPIHLQVDEHERAFLERRVDAVVTYEPVRSRLLAAGARVVFDSTRIPGEIVDVLVARAAIVDRHLGALAALVRGWLLAADALRTRPLEASELLAPRMHLPADQVPAAFAGMRLTDLAENRRLLEGEPPPLATTAQRLLESMLANGFIQRAPDLARLFDPRVVLRVSLPAAG